MHQKTNRPFDTVTIDVLLFDGFSIIVWPTRWSVFAPQTPLPVRCPINGACFRLKEGLVRSSKCDVRFKPEMATATRGTAAVIILW